MKKYILLFSLLILIVIPLIMWMNTPNQETKSENKVLNIVQFYIKDRTIIKNNNEIIVGNNVKEIENGYYDFKICNSNGEIIIYLNKLWYESYDETYIQDNYLIDICKEFTKQLQIKKTPNMQEEIYNYIKNNFYNVKQGKSVADKDFDWLSLSFESCERNGKIDSEKEIV